MGLSCNRTLTYANPPLTFPHCYLLLIPMYPSHLRYHDSLLWNFDSYLFHFVLFLSWQIVICQSLPCLNWNACYRRSSKSIFFSREQSKSSMTYFSHIFIISTSFISHHYWSWANRAVGAVAVKSLILQAGCLFSPSRPLNEWRLGQNKVQWGLGETEALLALWAAGDGGAGGLRYDSASVLRSLWCHYPVALPFPPLA